MALYAVASAAFVIALALLHAHQTGMGWAAPLQPGSEGAAAGVIADDFPDLQMPAGRGHDGQYFYAVARAPTDLDAVSDQLGRPRYRLQRPLFSAAAWALSLGSTGPALVAAMVVVGAASLVALGFAAGWLSVQLGGSPAVAAVPLLPGCLWSFRLSLADNMALALALLFLASVHRERTLAAVAFAVAAALTKEAMLLIIVAKAVADRRRASAFAAVAALTATGGWWLFLRARIDADGPQVKEVGWPLGGIVDNLELWLSGEQLIAAASVIGALSLAVFGLVRHRSTHSLFAPLLASALFSLVLTGQVLGLNHNGSRAMVPLLVLGIVTAASPAPAGPDRDGERRPQAPLARCWG